MVWKLGWGSSEAAAFTTIRKCCIQTDWWSMSRLYLLWMRYCFEWWMTCVWPDCQWLSTKERMMTETDGIRKENEQRTARVTACASGSRMYQWCALSLYVVTTFVIVTVATGSSLAEKHNDLVHRRPVKGLFNRPVMWSLAEAAGDLCLMCL